MTTINPQTGKPVNVEKGKPGFQPAPPKPEAAVLDLDHSTVIAASNPDWSDNIEPVADLKDGDRVWDADNGVYRTVKFVDSGPQDTYVEWDDGEVELLDNDHRFPVVTDQITSVP